MLCSTGIKLVSDTVKLYKMSTQVQDLKNKNKEVKTVLRDSSAVRKVLDCSSTGWRSDRIPAHKSTHNCM